jgi:hypothetical protein
VSINTVQHFVGFYYHNQNHKKIICTVFFFDDIAKKNAGKKVNNDVQIIFNPFTFTTKLTLKPIH